MPEDRQYGARARFACEKVDSRAPMQNRDFVPMQAGTAWGAKWEYGWFKGEFVLPAEAAGERIVLVVEPGGESIIFVNIPAPSP